MKKTIIAAAVLSFALAAPAFAAGGDQPPMGTGPNFDQRKAEILKALDAQMSSLQEAKTCIQAAKNHDAIKACREKHMAERKELHEEMQKKIHREEQNK
jgi:hypothetical protein